MVVTAVVFQVTNTFFFFLPLGFQIFVEFWLNQNSLVADIPTFAHGAMVSCAVFFSGLLVKVELSNRAEMRDHPIKEQQMRDQLCV